MVSHQSIFTFRSSSHHSIILAIQSKTKAKFLLNWLWERNRVQIHVVTKKEAKEMNKAKRWEFTVNEENEAKAESKQKEKYKYPKYKVRDEDASHHHKEEAGKPPPPISNDPFGFYLHCHLLLLVHTWLINYWFNLGGVILQRSFNRC